MPIYEYDFISPCDIFSKRPYVQLRKMMNMCESYIIWRWRGGGAQGPIRNFEPNTGISVHGHQKPAIFSYFGGSKIYNFRIFKPVSRPYFLMGRAKISKHTHFQTHLGTKYQKLKFYRPSHDLFFSRIFTGFLQYFLLNTGIFVHGHSKPAIFSYSSIETKKMFS